MDRIKESFDSLPIAACFFDGNGVVRLINHRMLAISNFLRKGGIQTLSEMEDALRSPPADVDCLSPQLRIYRLPDGTAMRFAQEKITTKAGIRYTQVTAADVTELIRKQTQLREENAKLTEANERLRTLFEQMPEIIREEETLAMKLRVHDDIGYSILSARRALLRKASLEEIRANAALWEQSITVLYRSNQIDGGAGDGTAGGGDPARGGDGRQGACGRKTAEIAEAPCIGRAGDPRMYGKLRSPRGRHGAVCAALAGARLHGYVPEQQRCAAQRGDHGGRRPFDAAAARGGGGRQHGDPEQS